VLLFLLQLGRLLLPLLLAIDALALFCHHRFSFPGGLAVLGNRI
jgi:hypothetical protein